MKDIKRLSEQVKAQGDEIKGETATKLNKIVPFFRALGYDDANPNEFQAEVSVYTKGSMPGRVDFACGNGPSMQIFIEAKKSGKKLKNDMEQLKEYYDASPDVFLGVLTNGEEYLFFRDGEKKGIMDVHPFYEVDMRYVDEGDMTFLKKLQKGKLTRKHVKNINIDPYLSEKIIRQQLAALCSN